MSERGIESLWLNSDLAEPERAAAAAKLCQRLLLPHRARVFNGSTWILLERSESALPEPNLEPHSPEWFAALLAQGARRWDRLCSEARSLSGAWPGDVVSVEGRANWVRYARWQASSRVRYFEYSALTVGASGWVHSEGVAESWEDDEEVGPDIASLALALALPTEVTNRWADSP